MEEKIIVTRSQRSPALAGILAFFLPFGVGAFYNRQFFKGFVYLLIFSGLVTIQSTAVAPVFWALMLAGFFFYQLIETVQDTKAYNRRLFSGENVEEERIEAFPEAVKSGSIFWGIVLISLGAIFLLANFELISYDFVWNYWPLAIIAVGVKFVLDYLARNKPEN